ncbi:retrovirus-related pol polyprotein from transposon TNT 1-94 [Tanacetum coccineum]
MVVLQSCAKHNVVAYLEKTDGNTDFHEIIDFFTRSSIHYALTVSPVVSTTFVEQFWMSAKSKIINNVRYITAKVAGKPVSISEASIRSDLLFDDADGIDSLPNQAIFDAIQLMGYEGDLTVLTFNKALFSPQWRFLFHTMNHCLSSKSTSWDQIPTNIATARMRMQDQKDHLNHNLQPLLLTQVKFMLSLSLTPSPKPSPTSHIPDSIPESSGGNHEDQAKEIQHLKAQIKKLKKKAKPIITHHRAWMKSVSLKQRLAGKKSLKKKWMQKESVSKQGRKSAKAEPTVHKDKDFDELDDDEIYNMGTEDAQEMGKTRYVVHEEKERKEKEVSTEDALSTDKEKDSIDKPDEGTDKQKVSTDKEKDNTNRLDEGTVDQTEGRSATPKTPTPTPTTFGDDKTIAQVLLNMSQAKAVSREKEKGAELKDVENIKGPRPTSTRSLLTLKPLPKIDPKDKGEKKIKKDESDTESEDINAIDTSTYIINRVSIKRILGKTPYELLRGSKPNLNYFRVFGSKCFILNTKDYLTKFDPKSYEGVFLGYSQNSKAYIILNKQTMKVEESLNVTFDETPPPPKTSPLEDDELVEEDAIEYEAVDYGILDILKDRDVMPLPSSRLREEDILFFPRSYCKECLI